MTRLMLSIFTLATLCPGPCLATEAVQAHLADDLVDSISVNTHFGYTDRPYWKRFDDVGAKLGELGVRHIRDGVDTRPAVANRVRALHENSIRVGSMPHMMPKNGHIGEHLSFVNPA